MTLQGCPGGSGFFDYKSVNARKTFVCALYSHEKRLPKRFQAPQGRHLEPPTSGSSRRRPWGGAPENGSWKTAPGSGSRAPMCRAISRHLWWLPVFGYAWSDSLGRPQELPVCGSPQSSPRVVAPGIGSPGVVPHTSPVQCWFFGRTGGFLNLLECKLGMDRFWKVFSWFVASLAS